MKFGEAEKQYKLGSAGYFSLKDDGDKAEVRFLYDFSAIPMDDLDLEAVDCYVVHDVEVNGRNRWKECTTKSDCPECLKGNKPKLRMFIQLVNLATNEVEVWDRPASYASRLMSKVQTYGPLCNRPYLITRIGAKGDTNTKYEIDALDKDGKTLADMPGRVDIMGTMLISANDAVSAAQKAAQVSSLPPRAVSQENVF